MITIVLFILSLCILNDCGNNRGKITHQMIVKTNCVVQEGSWYFSVTFIGFLCLNIQSNKLTNLFDVGRKMNLNGLKFFSPYLCLPNSSPSPNMWYINRPNIKLLYQLDFWRSAYGNFFKQPYVSFVWFNQR